MFGDDVGIARRNFRGEPGCLFVASTDFCRLLISRLDLKRADEAVARLIGLRDMSTGLHYFIELEKLGVYR